MGTIFTGRTLTPAQVEAALSEPVFIEKLLYGEPLDDDDSEGDEVDWAAVDTLEPEDGGDVIRVDLEKSWESVHFLLTTTAGPPSSPLAMAIMGGRPIDADDRGYAHSYLLNVDQVRTIATAFAALDIAQLREHFDPLAFQAAGLVTRVDWLEEDAFDDYLRPSVRELAAFYKAAAAAESAVLLTLD